MTVLLEKASLPWHRKLRCMGNPVLCSKDGQFAEAKPRLTEKRKRFYGEIYDWYF